MLSFGDTFINTQKYEVLEHGTAEFPIACYFDNLNQKFNPWHWHEEFEVGIVRENPVMISTPDREDITLQDIADSASVRKKLDFLENILYLRPVRFP